jgi:hypothetical protein
MVDPCQQHSLDEAFERIEETILPSISMMLDTLLEAATLGQPGIDAEIYATELRTIALQLEALTKQIEAISPAHLDARDYRISSAA